MDRMKSGVHPAPTSVTSGSGGVFEDRADLFQRGSGDEHPSMKLLQFEQYTALVIGGWRFRPPRPPERQVFLD